MSVDTIRRWLTILESVYFSFRVRPWFCTQRMRDATNGEMGGRMSNIQQGMSNGQGGDLGGED